MNRLFYVMLALIFGVLAVALVKRSAFSSGPQVRRNYLSENLQPFQGEWSAAPADRARGIIAEFKGRSLRLVSSSKWRRTHTIAGFEEIQGKQVLVVDEGEDGLVYRFEGEDVLWLEIKQEYGAPGELVRFGRAIPPE